MDDLGKDVYVYLSAYVLQLLLPFVCLQVSSGLTGQDTGSGHTSLLGTQVNNNPHSSPIAGFIIMFGCI